MGFRLSLLSLLLLTAAWCPAQSSPAPEPAVCRITFNADGPVEEAELRERVTIKPGDPLDLSAVRTSIENLYTSGDFYYVECTSIQEACGTWLDFRLVCRRYFSRFVLRGTESVRKLDTDLARLFPLGEAFTENRLQRFSVEAEKFLFDRGYSPTRLTSGFEADPAGIGISVTLTVQAGKAAVLRQIEYRGDAVLPEKTMRKVSKLKPGKPYSREKLLEAVENLKQAHARRDYLDPTITVEDISLDDAENVTVVLGVRSGPHYKVVVQGADVKARTLRELLPIYREADIDNDLLQEGRDNLKAHLLRAGYSSADIAYGAEGQPTDPERTITYRVKLGQKLVIKDIATAGLKELKRDDFLTLIGEGNSGLRPERYFTLAGFEAAAERVIREYRDRGYLDARFARRELTIAETGRVDLEFEVAEGERSLVRNLTVTGNQQITQADLTRRIPLEPGQPFSEQRLEVARRYLQEFCLSQGYPQSRVQSDWQKQAGGVVDVSFQVQEGPGLTVNHVAVVGTNRTHLRSVLKNVGFGAGDPLVVKRLFEGEQKLYNTGGFDLVRIRTNDAELNDPHQTVVVGVRETRPRILNFGGGYQDFEGVRGLLELNYLNVRGTLRTATIRLRGSKLNQSVQLTLRDPRPLNRNVESYASLLLSRKEEVSFTEERFGASLQLLKDISKVNSLVFRYSYEHVAVPKADVAISEIPRISQPITLSSLSAAFINDSRDNPFDPVRGAFSSVNLQWTTPLVPSDARFLKFLGQSQYYRALPGKLQLLEALRLGMAARFDGDDPLLPISERFFAGGSNTLRGFGYEEAGPRDPETGSPVGGNALVVNNLELRFPLVSRFSGVLFYDTGNVFSQVKDIRLADFSHSVGFGLKIATPIGPIRFDYGINLDPPPGQSAQHFFFSFGPIF